MMRLWIQSSLLVVLLMGSWAMAADTQEVTVTGMGTSEKLAIRDAQRQAVEQVAGTLVYSQSKTRDFVLEKDTILARAAGFVKSYKVLKKRFTEDDLIEVRLRVVVAKKAINDMWGIVRNLLKEQGRPKIMLRIVEKVDGKVREKGTAQTRTEGMLIKSGFDIVNRSIKDAKKKKQLDDAISNGDVSVAQALAKEFKADIYIVGTARATSSGSRMLYGKKMFKYGGSADITMAKTDTGKTITSVDSPNTAGVNENRMSAARDSLKRVGDALAPTITQDVLRYWMDVVAGDEGGELEITVTGMTKASDYFKLKKQLKKIKNIKEFNGKFNKARTRISLMADCNAEELAEILAEKLDGVLEISDFNRSTIEASYVGK